MKKNSSFAFLLLLGALVGCVTKVVLPPKGEWTVVSVSELARPPKPEGLSGVTRAPDRKSVV